MIPIVIITRLQSEYHILLMLGTKAFKNDPNGYECSDLICIMNDSNKTILDKYKKRTNV